MSLMDVLMIVIFALTMAGVRGWCGHLAPLLVGAVLGAGVLLAFAHGAPLPAHVGSERYLYAALGGGLAGAIALGLLVGVLRLFFAPSAEQALGLVSLAVAVVLGHDAFWLAQAREAGHIQAAAQATADAAKPGQTLVTQGLFDTARRGRLVVHTPLGTLVDARLRGMSEQVVRLADGTTQLMESKRALDLPLPGPGIGDPAAWNRWNEEEKARERAKAEGWARVLEEVATHARGMATDAESLREDLAARTWILPGTVLLAAEP
jgi:hypothetical protein